MHAQTKDSGQLEHRKYSKRTLVVKVTKMRILKKYDHNLLVTNVECESENCVQGVDHQGLPALLLALLLLIATNAAQCRFLNPK